MPLPQLSPKIKAWEAARKASALPVAPTLESINTQTMPSDKLGGLTSTILTGYQGEDETKLKTSKILLGAG